MKEYIFNENDVCINSDIELSLSNPSKRGFLLQISVAQYNDKWVSGYSYSCFEGGGGAPCSLRRNELCDTKEQAIILAVKEVKNRLKGHKYKYETIILSDFITNYLKPKPVQLLLF